MGLWSRPRAKKERVKNVKAISKTSRTRDPSVFFFKKNSKPLKKENINSVLSSDINVTEIQKSNKDNMENKAAV